MNTQVIPPPLLSSFNNLMNIVGSTSLTTTAQNVTDAINELSDKIGNTTLTTTAKTLTGAIEELKDKTVVKDVKSLVTWSTSTFEDMWGRSKFYRVGNVVIANLYIWIRGDYTANNSVTIFTVDNSIKMINPGASYPVYPMVMQNYNNGNLNHEVMAYICPGSQTSFQFRCNKTYSSSSYYAVTGTLMWFIG